MTKEIGRIDLHTHTLLSDGVLTPSELIRRAADKGFSAFAITDHADAANLDIILTALTSFRKQSRDHFGLTVICGVELTHVPPQDILPLAKKAKKGGAEIVVVHGETPVEPVIKGTNLAAVKAKGYVDILAHPGFITKETAEIAAKNEVFLEITSRHGHGWTNGHVVIMGRAAKAKFVINTDTHKPGDLISLKDARQVGLGAGLSEKETQAALLDNPLICIKKLGIKTPLCR